MMSTTLGGLASNELAKAINKSQAGVQRMQYF